MSKADKTSPNIHQSKHSLTISPVLEKAAHERLLQDALREATRTGRVDVIGPLALRDAVNGIYSLAQWQSGFKQQGSRGSCWAFAGAAALEAAYRRKYNMLIDVSEEYVFQMGKAFALNRDAAGNVLTPIENNSSLTGFQGSGDIAKKLSENAVCGEDTAAYIKSQTDLLSILPQLGYANQAALVSQADFDALEFCEQHIHLLARVNCRYRAAGWGTIGNNPSITAIENVILADREVIADVTHLTAPIGGHVLLIIGFDRNRRVFFAKNHWGEGTFIEIAYANDPNWTIDSGWYITDVVDPTWIQSEACWLGNWRVNIGDDEFRLILRRSEDFANPGQPTRLGSAYLGDGPHDVNGSFSNNGAHLTFYVAPSTASTAPGTLSGWQFNVDLNFSDIYNASGWANFPALMTRFNTRFAAIFERADGNSIVARHAIDSQTYQAEFNTLTRLGYRPTWVNGYSEGIGMRFNGVWEQRQGPAWAARHDLTDQAFQTVFDDLTHQGYRPRCISGYAENGQARYAAIWEQVEGPQWQARHGLSRSQYQQTFDQMAADGFSPIQVSGYRVGIDVRFAAIWEQRPGLDWVGRHALTGSEYQTAFDQNLELGYHLVSVCGYSDTGIARYAAIWHRNPASDWQAKHAVDAAGYQKSFDDLVQQGFRPVVISGYGDGFYPA